MVLCSLCVCVCVTEIPTSNGYGLSAVEQPIASANTKRTKRKGDEKKGAPKTWFANRGGWAVSKGTEQTQQTP